MYECLRAPLDATDIKPIREAVACSIEKGDGHLVVYGRLLGHYGLYDFFVGVGDAAATPEADCGHLGLPSCNPWRVFHAILKWFWSKKPQ